MDINRNNYETFFLLYLDRELNEADRGTVENFLIQNPDLQKEFRLLQNTVLYPSEVVFAQKETLYRQEEKRRVIPVYWLRFAAAISLILAGGWFMMTVLKNYGTDTAGNKEKVVRMESKKNPDAVAADKITTVTQKEEGKKGPDHNQVSEKDISLNGNQSRQKNRHPVGRNTETAKGQTGLIPEEPNEYAIQKSSATMGILKSGSMSGAIEPVSLTVPGSIQTPALTVSVAGRGITSENERESEPNVQTDNAISVVALNDQNKAIAGFFKKLTKRATGDETANNSKKLRVSVFQFSY